MVVALVIPLGNVKHFPFQEVIGPLFYLGVGQVADQVEKLGIVSEGSWLRSGVLQDAGYLWVLQQPGHDGW